MKKNIQHIIEEFFYFTKEEHNQLILFVDFLYTAINMDISINLIEEQIKKIFSGLYVKGWNSQHAINAISPAVMNELTIGSRKTSNSDANEIDLENIRYEILPETSKHEPKDKDNKTPSRIIRKITSYYEQNKTSSDNFYELLIFRTTKKNTKTFDYYYVDSDLMFFHLFYNNHYIPPYHQSLKQKFSSNSSSKNDDKAFFNSIIKTANNLSSFYDDRKKYMTELKTYSPDLKKQEKQEKTQLLSIIGDLLLLRKIDQTYNLIMSKNCFKGSVGYNINFGHEDSLNIINRKLIKSSLEWGTSMCITKQLILDFLFLKQHDIKYSENTYKLSPDTIFVQFIIKMVEIYKKRNDQIKCNSYSFLVNEFSNEYAMKLASYALDLSMFKNTFNPNKLKCVNKLTNAAVRRATNPISALLDIINNQ